MYTVEQVNILLESISLLVQVILLVLLTTGGNRSGKLNRLFRYIIICDIAVLAFDIISWVLVGNTAPYSLLISRVAVFFAFVLPFLAGGLFTAYIIELINEKVTISKVYPGVLYTIIGLGMLFVVISQFNGMYYYFDENNMYHPNDFIWLSEVLGTMLISVITIMALRHVKSLGLSDTLFIISYVAVLFISIILQAFLFEDLELSFVASVIQCILIYGGIQVRRERQFKEIELRLAESRIDTMLSQIQPHFLYNSLAAIQRLCQKDPKLAEETVVEFTNYLRGNIDALSLKITIPFEKELEHTRSYLSIEKKRFGERVNIVYEIATVDFNLPALTLQPIVENAVRYGITKREMGGTVTISTLETDTEVQVSVVDDGIGFDLYTKKDDGRTHVGIENVRNRIEAMCGGTLTVQSRPGVGTTAIITIPKM